MKRRLTAAFLCLCLLFTLLPATAFAEGEPDSGVLPAQSALCEHHTQHTADCGYTEGTAEIPCSHEHTEDCYTLVTECVHEHTAECYPAESVSENTATPSEPEEAEPTACIHECSEDSGCITKTLDCKHQHDEACGYVPATEGTPCTYVCEICNAQDSGDVSTPSDAQPEECICETLCTEEEINGDCPVCSAEGAELDKVCVGAALLLAAPTLRTGGIEIYVGGQRITESGCYENKSGTWTKVDGTEPASGQFYYDADTVTLTLNGVEISRDQPVSVGSGKYYHGSVIAFSQSADVSLKIVVSQGTSNITGSGGIRVMSEAGDASLSISGPGNLEVNVNSNDSGITLIGSQNVNLNIDGADVKTLAAYYYGVDLHAGDGFKAAAVVNNGKLTAGGSGGIGIYYRWTNPSDSGTSSLTVSGNAVVDTRDSKILIASQASEVQVSAGSDGNGGIVFDGKSGTVYGDVTLQEDLEIGTDETLTIGKDASLTVPDGKTLTNDGTITVESGGNLEGTPTGNGTLKIAPTISTQPQDVEVKENETATFTVRVTGTEPLSYQWQQNMNGSGWADITGETNATYTTGKTTMDMNGTQYRCVVSNSAGSVISDAATLTVQKSTTPIDPKYVRYIVEHYKQNTDGSYTLADTEQPIDEIGKTVTATPKTYEGYTYNPNAAGTVVSGTLKAISSPDDIVTLKLYYDITLYTVTVNGSYAQTTGAGGYAKDATVTIDAGTRSGYTFDGWTSADGVTFANAGNAQTTFTMPDKAVTVTANWKKNSGGGGGGSSYDYYTITASAGTGGSISPSGSVSVREDTDKTFTITPAEGYIIADVLVDGVSVKHQLTNRQYIFKDVWTSHTIKASFAWVGAGTVSPFTDVKTSDWFYAAVMDVYQRGIMSGTSSTTFSPYADTTRSQLAVILWRMAGSPEPAQAVPFTDIPAGAYYEKAVVWCAEQGLVSGYGGSLFGPDDPITREQAVVFLFNFANYKKFDTRARADLSVYADTDKISAWALDAVKWANAEGILTGSDQNTLTPQGRTLRAQMAAMLSRFLARYDQDFILLSPGGGNKINPNTGGGPGSPITMENSPQTGDNTPIWPFVALPVSAAGLVTSTILYYKRRKEEDKEPAYYPA